MSDRRIGWVLAVALTTGAPAVAAQTPEEQALLERLAARAELLRVRVTVADSLVNIRHDTVRVGSLLLLTDSGRTVLMRTAAAELETALVRAFGTPAPAVLAGARIVVRFGPPQPGWGALIGNDAQFIQVLRQRTTPQRLAAALTHAVNTLLWLRGGAGLHEWHADLRLLDETPDPLWRTTYTELLTSTAPHATACFRGVTVACREALRLTDDPMLPPDTSALQRYVETEFRARATQPRYAAAYVACTERADPVACRDVIERAGFAIPGLSTRARGTVLLQARASAGPDAYTRFFADSASPITARLERAAGQPIDTLLAAWHATVMAHRPTPLTTPAAMQWLTLGWVALLAAVATRSSRWR